MTAPVVERPDWRQVNIRLLAAKLYAAHAASDLHNVEFTLDRCSPYIIEAWERAAEAAVDELIDKPNRKFQAQLDALLASDVVEDEWRHDSPPASEWRAATAKDWL